MSCCQVDAYWHFRGILCFHVTGWMKSPGDMQQIPLKPLYISTRRHCMTSWKIFQNTNLVHNSFNLQQYICYTTLLNMFRAACCSSWGGPIVSPQPLVSSPSVSSCTVRGWRADCSLLSTRVLYSCLQRMTIPEAVVIQLVLLMMSSVLLETCWGV